ncbi:hypothetical protein L7F22_022490 [Adiantum nelumboides]|nr:hypothetical protein [Adiantum nelumboides]
MAASPFSNPRPVVKKLLSKEQPEGDGARVRRSIGIKCRLVCLYILVTDSGCHYIFYVVSAPAGFPDHPHRGFETVTYMLEGAFTHQDFAGHKGTIKAGDLQSEDARLYNKSLKPQEQYKFVRKLFGEVKRGMRYTMTPRPHVVDLENTIHVFGTCVACGEALEASYVVGTFMLSCKHQCHPLCFAAVLRICSCVENGRYVREGTLQHCNTFGGKGLDFREVIIEE